MKILGGLLDRWPYLKAMGFIAENALWLIRHRIGWNRITYGTHKSLRLQESVNYVEQVFADYLRYGQLERFHGTVAEIGPGDNGGVALLIRNSGAQHVDLVERFENVIDEGQQQEIYEALSHRHPLERFRIGPQWKRMELSGVTWWIGASAEQFMAGCADGTYDFIVSRAVLEHLAKPISTLRQMVRALRPGGLLLHEVDLRDHEHFSRRLDELTWLKFPSWLWRVMTSQSGRPNRVLAHRYRRALEGLRGSDGIEYQLLVKTLVGAQSIDPAVPWEEIPLETRERALAFVTARRHTFARELQGIDAADLALTTVVIVARKPA